MPAAARKIALTDRSLKGLRAAPDGGRLTVWDALMPSLAVRVSAKGKRTFYVVKRMAGAAQASWVTLGEYPAMTLAEARARAREVLASLARGEDPAAAAEARRVEAAAVARSTFGALAEAYIASRLPRLRSARAAEALIRRELIPALGPRPLATIRRRDIVTLLEAIVARGAGHPGRLRPKSGGEYAARHAFAALSAMFSWALARDWENIEANPCAGIRAADLFGGPARARDRVLNDDEIRWLWRVLDAEPGPFGVLYKVLLLTGQRRDEISRARWREIDADRLTIPAERMKNKRQHEVPLTAAVMELLRALPRFTGGDFIFTTTGGRSPISGFSRAQARVRAAVERVAGAPVPHWEVHDLRRTARTGLATTGATPFIGELVVAHRQAGVHGVYDLHRYEDEKRAALERWEARLLNIVGAPEPGNIVPMRARA